MWDKSETAIDKRKVGLYISEGSIFLILPVYSSQISIFFLANAMLRVERFHKCFLERESTQLYQMISKVRMAESKHERNMTTILFTPTICTKL